MKKRESTPADAAELRARAEHRLEEKSTRSEPNSRADESQRLIHELQVHQIELELQNEQLQEARADLEAALSRYSDLYDFAPVGYLTLDRDGVIQKVNLTGARLLGIDRARLIGARLGTFVSSECRPIFNTLLREVFASRTKEACDVALCPEHCAAVSVWVHIEAVAFNDGGRECRAVLIDISGRKLAEKVRQAILGFKPTVATAIPAADSESSESPDSSVKNPQMHFIPIDYKKDFQLVRWIDDSFDPRLDASPKSHEAPTTAP